MTSIRSTPEPVVSSSASLRWQPAKIHNPRRDAVSEAFARSQGMKNAETARQRLMKLRQETVAAIHAYRIHGSPERYAEYISPMVQALSGPAPKLTLDLVADCQQVDLAEDQAENEARSYPSRESRLRWASKAEAEAAALSKLAAALRAECAE